MSDPAELVYIALGSNLGNSREILELAFLRLQSLSAGPILKSSLRATAPIDCPPGSPDFLNAVIGLVPFAGETPELLLQKLQALEREFGRLPKKVMNEARPLDLDIIAFKSETRNNATLTIPHPRAHLRAFVLQPLAEIAPALVLPGRPRTIAEELTKLGIP